MFLEVSTHNMPFFECLSSESRIRIIELLNEKPMNIKDLAVSLGISSAIVTKHVQKLQKAGIVQCESIAGIRGLQKICRLHLDQAVLQFLHKKQDEPTYTASIPVGQYAAFEVKPTCGLASASQIIGIIDDPRYFADPQHVHANHLWFGSGYVEYRIPNFIHGHQQLRSLSISFEICSEAPGYNDQWPSDISFFINDVPLGLWTCPGDFGSQKGVHTPDWWMHGTQHGLLKTLNVHQEGTYLDGVRMSNVTVSDLSMAAAKDVSFRIASLESSAYCGGISLFGKHFGNYNQDIEVSMHCVKI
jgi:predicted transcriptional regulator